MTLIRSLALPLTAATTLLTASAAMAGPTCQSRDGATVRCGSPGAMPVGWTLPSDRRAVARDADDLAPAQWFGLAALVGGLFAMIALMPNFDGWGEIEDKGEDEG